MTPIWDTPLRKTGTLPKRLIDFFRSVIPVDGIYMLVELHLLGCTHILDAPYLVSRMILLMVLAVVNE